MKIVAGFVLMALLATAAVAQEQGAGTEIRPGLLLTSDALVWVLDDSDVKRLLPIAHQDATIAGNTGANFLRSTVMAKQKKIVVVSGTKAASRIKATKLVLYVQLTEAEAREISRSSPSDQVRYEIVRLEPQATDRLVGRFEFSRFTGKPMFSQTVIKTKQARFGDSQWLELILLQPLPTGEYGLVQVLPRPDVYSPWIFDFGVD
jgi:hypothetical protein